MSTLEELKKQLQSKPIVHNREPVVIHLENNESTKINKSKPELQTEPDINIKINDKRQEGYNPDKFLSRIKQTKLAVVIPKKDINEPVIIESKAPEIIEPIKPVKVKKIKQKLGKEFVIIGDNETEPGKKIPEQEQEQEQRQEQQPEIQIPTKEARVSKKTKTSTVDIGKTSKIQIGDTPMNSRIPRNPPNINIKVSSYFMNNREIFVNFINGLFEPYRQMAADTKQNISCDNIGQSSGEAELLIHQKIVRDYINLYTPYRGLLLFHGLGSGKTFSSIAIAEGFKSTNRIIVMTPASLRRNYLEEIKKYGDLLYRKNQYWEWISVITNPETLNTLSVTLGLSPEYIKRKKGAWLVNVTKTSNYSSLSSSDRKKIDEQIDEMIQNKYTFINYNGLRKERFDNMTQNDTINIFDNAVVIIDEAHNLISRIVNKINKISSFNEKLRGPHQKYNDSLSLKIYEMLLRATNCRVVLLSGTPIINYPNEIGILFNILRGYIKSWNFTLNVETTNKLNVETLSEMFSRNKILDYISYKPTSKILTITRNPYGFENKITSGSGYKGVTNEKKEKKNEKGEVILDERGVLSDEDFIRRVVSTLKDNGITAIPNGTTFNVNTALPDTLKEFEYLFIDKNTKQVHNMEKFKKRIVGLTSFFRSAQEELLPAYEKNTDFHLVKIYMSDYQFKIYEEARIEERIIEKNISKEFGKSKTNEQSANKDDIFKEPSSTYRIFSRLFCNFVMPKSIRRPMPKNIAELNVNVNVNVDENNELVEKKLVKKRGPKTTRKENTSSPKAVTRKKRTGGASDNEDQDQDQEQDEQNIPPIQDETEKREEKGDEVLEEKEAEAEAEINALPDDDEIIEMSDYRNEDANTRTRTELEGDELLEILGGQFYREQIKESMRLLKENGSEYLSPEGLQTYGPKFLAMLNNIQDPNHLGLHLIYSQFRSMEGIGIFCLVLEQNGFAQFKIKKVGAEGWTLDMKEEDLGKPTFALYTGTEEADEREIIRNIYNGDWQYIPTGLAAQLKRISSNNLMGEIIKILMITAAGSEGINLRNTRYVHLMEPYWHPVRLEQVIGRARRICSHKDLPLALQTVEVFLYLMIFTEQQLASDEAVELKINDISRIDGRPLTSDQKLFEISSIKEEITKQLLKAIKESSIDCAIHSQIPSAKSKQNKTKEQLGKEQLHCLSFGTPSVEEFTYNPSYTQDENDTVTQLNKKVVTWSGIEVKIPIPNKYGGIDKKTFILRENTNDLYDYEMYKEAQEVPGVVPAIVGKIKTKPNGEIEYIPV